MAESIYLRQTLGAIAKENHGRARIFTLGILNLGRRQEDFMKKLAAYREGH